MEWILDFIIIILKHKFRFTLVTIMSLGLGYLSVYYFIEPKYDSYAVVIPVDDRSELNINSILSEAIPLGLGEQQSSSLYLAKTILHSRTKLLEVIDRFDLYKIYKVEKHDKESEEQMIKMLRENINVDDSEDFSLSITVRTIDPILSASITNYLVELLNESIIELKVQKYRDNSEFLMSRLQEYKKRQKTAEESLLIFQKEKGILELESQIKEWVSFYTNYKKEILKLEYESTILSNVYSSSSPQFKEILLRKDELKNQYQEILNNGSDEGVIISFKNLPNELLTYIRLKREIEISDALIKFIVPLYEQSKIEEQKRLPILQIIDEAFPPVKKSFPPRTLFALLFTAFVLLVLLFYYALIENKVLIESKKVSFIKNNLFRWRLHN